MKLQSVRIYFLLPCLLVLLIKGNYAQVSDQFQVPDSGFIQVLNTTDGSSYVGKIISVTNETVEFKTDIGVLNIQKQRIKSIKTHHESVVKDGEFWFPDPNASRLYFAPKGKMLKQGEGYYQNIWILFSSVSYGFTDNITVGIGTTVIPELEFYYITPKIGLYSSENLDFAAGALLISVLGNTAGILYGVGSYGTGNTNFTMGLGYGFADGVIAEKPMVTLGFDQRLSRRTSFISENWIFPGFDDPLISYGIRFFGESIAVDVAFYNTLDGFYFPGFPYLDFVFNF